MQIKPHTFFFIATLGILIFGLGFEQDWSFDLNIHDSYLVVDHASMIVLSVFILFGLWTFYTLVDRYIYPLHRGMVWLHIALSLGSLFLGLFWTFNDPIVSDLQAVMPLFDAYERQMERISLVVLIFLLGQFMFPINIFRSVILRARNRRLEV